MQQWKKKPNSIGISAYRSVTWSQCVAWKAQIRSKMDHYQRQSYVLRSDIFWMTCCTTSRLCAHLTVSSNWTLSGTQNASFLSSVNWQTANMLDAPTISRRRSFRSREKNKEQMERLALGTDSDTVFLPVVKKSLRLNHQMHIILTLLYLHYPLNVWGLYDFI